MPKRGGPSGLDLPETASVNNQIHNLGSRQNYNIELWRQEQCGN